VSDYRLSIIDYQLSMIVLCVYLTPDPRSFLDLNIFLFSKESLSLHPLFKVQIDISN